MLGNDGNDLEPPFIDNRIEKIAKSPTGVRELRSLVSSYRTAGYCPMGVHVTTEAEKLIYPTPMTRCHSRVRASPMTVPCS